MSPDPHPQDPRSGTTGVVQHQDVANRAADIAVDDPIGGAGSTTVAEILVEEISIDGMCGVY